jgi:NDP-sugar pyrophosphorylase family protein
MEAHRDLLTLKNSWTEKFIFRKRAHQRGRKSTVFLGEKTQLAKDVILKGMVCCGRGVRIAAGATIEDSILLDNVRIEKNATVTGSILGTGSKVESGVIVPPGSVLGDKTRIKRQTQQ